MMMMEGTGEQGRTRRQKVPFVLWSNPKAIFVAPTRDKSISKECTAATLRRRFNVPGSERIQRFAQRFQRTPASLEEGLVLRTSWPLMQQGLDRLGGKSAGVLGRKRSSGCRHRRLPSTTKHHKARRMDCKWQLHTERYGSRSSGHDSKE